MKFREHRGGLAESMETLVELKDTEELEAYLLKLWYPFGIDEVDLKIEEYTLYGGPRIGWDKLYLVSASKLGVVGWLDSVVFPGEVK
jgi:hypothetical protein